MPLRDQSRLPSAIRPGHIAAFWLGIGLSTGADAGELIALVDAVIAQSGLDPAGCRGIGTIETRRDHPVLSRLSARFPAPLVFFDAAALEAQTPRLKNPSEALFARIGCHGVAEAAALAAAGPEAELVVEKTAGRHITVAIAATAEIL